MKAISVVITRQTTGVPYVLDSFDLLGILPSKKLLVNGEGWKPEPGKVEKRRMEMPIEDAVVRFP